MRIETPSLDVQAETILNPPLCWAAPVLYIGVGVNRPSTEASRMSEA